MLQSCFVAIKPGSRVLEVVLPKSLVRPDLDKQRLGRLTAMTGNLRVGDAEARVQGVLGREYHYFLSQLVGAEARKGGEFHTLYCVVPALVEIPELYRGWVYDPRCGS